MCYIMLHIQPIPRKHAVDENRKLKYKYEGMRIINYSSSFQISHRRGKLFLSSDYFSPFFSLHTQITILNVVM